MLALVQVAAAYILTLSTRVAHAELAARALVFGGWCNPLPYFLRAYGYNGFRLSGQRFPDSLIALLGLVSAAATTLGWFIIVRAWFPYI